MEAKMEADQETLKACREATNAVCNGWRPVKKRQRPEIDLEEINATELEVNLDGNTALAEHQEVHREEAVI
jgi:hypothetical protein